MVLNNNNSGYAVYNEICCLFHKHALMYYNPIQVMYKMRRHIHILLSVKSLTCERIKKTDIIITMPMRYSVELKIHSLIYNLETFCNLDAMLYMRQYDVFVKTPQENLTRAILMYFDCIIVLIDRMNYVTLSQFMSFKYH